MSQRKEENLKVYQHLQVTKFQFKAFFDTQCEFAALSDVATEKSKSPYKASWGAQMNALMWRSWLSVIKEPLIVKVRIAQTIVSSFVHKYSLLSINLSIR